VWGRGEGYLYTPPLLYRGVLCQKSAKTVKNGNILVMLYKKMSKFPLHKQFAAVLCIFDAPSLSRLFAWGW
jgi:hypothetical protein